jgi:hypothetical protein
MASKYGTGNTGTCSHPSNSQILNAAQSILYGYHYTAYTTIAYQQIAAKTNPA